MRYLNTAPCHFVIVMNDDSPWARTLRCDTLTQAVSDAGDKARFAPDNAQYRAAYDAALSAARAEKCGGAG